MTNKVGVAQVLNRLNYSSTLSHRRINTPIEKTGKLVPPVKLNNTQWGYLCPCETPEGGAVGLVKNPSINSIITKNVNSEPVRFYLKDLGLVKIEDISITEIGKYGKVFVNGDWVADIPKWMFCIKICSMRRKGVINIFTSISWYIQLKELHINTESEESADLYM